MAAGAGAEPGDPALAGRSVPPMGGVPSEQLWRDAIQATRDAAAAAAELRRAMPRTRPDV